MTSLGLYQPGNSVLHRLSAGTKMLALVAFVIGLLFVHQPIWLVVPAALLVLGYLAARLPGPVIGAQLAPLRWFLPLLVVVQGLLVGWTSAALSGGVLLLSVAAAALLTLTTRVTAMLDEMTGLLRPFHRFGVDPDRVGLLLALTIRCVPLLVSLVREVGEARQARGGGFSLRALIAPTLVRALRASDAMGEALIARGVDD